MDSFEARTHEEVSQEVREVLEGIRFKAKYDVPTNIALWGLILTNLLNVAALALLK